MFCTRVAWPCLVCLLLCKEEGSSPVSLQLLRGGIWACMRCPCLCLCWVFGIGDYVSPTSIVCGIMFLLRAVLNILVRNASPKRAYVFYGA